MEIGRVRAIEAGILLVIVQGQLLQFQVDFLPLDLLQDHFHILIQVVFAEPLEVDSKVRIEGQLDLLSQPLLDILGWDLDELLLAFSNVLTLRHIPCMDQLKIGLMALIQHLLGGLISLVHAFAQFREYNRLRTTLPRPFLPLLVDNLGLDLVPDILEVFVGLILYLIDVLSDLVEFLLDDFPLLGELPLDDFVIELSVPDFLVVSQDFLLLIHFGLDRLQLPIILPHFQICLFLWYEGEPLPFYVK